MPSGLAAKIEGLLFVANRPLSLRKLAELCDASRPEIEAAIQELAERYEKADGGIRLVRGNDDVQLATAPDVADDVREFLKDETTGELSKPSLETLTIIAYRGPIAKSELEQIRGVNCSLILRNLLMRGLVESRGDGKEIDAAYSVTLDFLRFLGIASVADLPEYEKLRSHENVVRVVAMGKNEGGKAGQPAAETKG